MNRHIVSAGTALLLSIALVNVPWAETAPSSSPSPAASPPSADSAREPIFDGLGNLHHAVTTNSPLAQRFFDQGLTFVYAFNHDEAVGSFKEAARLDPKMAMAYWGIALSLGPNINLPEDTDRGKAAYEAIKHAQSLEANVSEPERQYIEALAKRYAADGKMNDSQQQAYANAMRDVAHRNPDDPDAGALFAESMMDLHPWKLWNADGTPVAGTDEIVATLEGVLAKFPDHVGANHYYIHAVEASPSPERALAGANKLASLAPNAGHIVHMPAHVYIRTGDYEAAVKTNEEAAIVDRAYIKASGAQGIYPMMYYSHNLHFIAMCSAMDGNYAEAKKNADMLAEHVGPAVKMMPPLEGFMTIPMAVELRFHRWDDVLAMKQPDPDMKTATVFWHFARGMALAGKGRVVEAEAEYKVLSEAEAATSPDATFAMPIYNKTKDILKIAENVLGAKIAVAHKDNGQAISLLTAAVAVQDTLKYGEPPDWFFPVRESLGGVLLMNGDAAGAEKVFRADLERNRRNPRSLFGLQHALKAQNRSYDAGFVETQFKASWKGGVTALKVEDLA